MTGFDDPRGPQSEELAFLAEQAARTGNRAQAHSFFERAAEIESAIARDVAGDQPRVRGVLAVSAVALWYKARQLARAERVAFEFLAADDAIDEQARAQLRQLVERCWRELAAAQLVGADALIEPLEIKLDGGEIRPGVAPVAAVRDRQAVVSTLIMRTAEMRAERPFRRRGESRIRGLQILEAPAVVGSYGLRLYVAASEQLHLPMAGPLTPRGIVEAFLEIAAAAQEGGGALAALVPDEDYRVAFLAGLRDLAPDGRHVGSVTFEHPVWDARRPRTVFEPHHRDALSSMLSTTPPGVELEHVEGLLKVINLKARAPSIEVVTSHGPAKQIRIDVERFGGTIGAMLNKLVRVDFEYRPGRRGRELHALDVSVREPRDEWPWEYAAREAVEAALTDAEWDPEEGVVVLMTEDHRGDRVGIEIEDVEDLRRELAEIASTAWHGSVPRDGGEAVFEADTDDIVEDALASVADKLADLGWE